jgi:hypothetical protein
MSQSVVLAPDEVAADHPCTDTSLYVADRGLLAYMLQDVRALVRLAVDGTRDVVGYEPITWFVHGLKRRIVPCDLDRLMDGGDLQVVGFFGSRRLAGGVDSTSEVVLHATKYWDYGPVPDGQPTWTAVRAW